MRVLSLAYVIALGAGIGLASAHYAVAHRPVVGLVKIGAWQTWPSSGGRDIDPYMRAYLARGVHLPLGAGEGVELVAEADDAGQELDGRCRYRISGTTPPTRAWTLTVNDLEGRVFGPPVSRTGFTDQEIVRDESGMIAIVAAAAVQPGNWLPLPGSRRFALRLRIYDTPLSGQAGELRPDMLPRISRVDCG